MLRNGIHEIKVYSPSRDTTKTFKISYIIKDLCVKHQDVGELYYNFIGGKWETTIKNLNIDVYLPNNQEEINIWGHGPYNGMSKIVSKNQANFTVSDIKPGQYVAARVIFDTSNIEESKKTSGIEYKENIFIEEEKIANNEIERSKYTKKVFIFAVILIAYWVVLLFIFEKDKKYSVSSFEDEELLKKYNPMLAGCIQGSRTILARDIIAVILGLINKKIITLEIQNVADEKENYIYFVKRNFDKENQMDEIERYVCNWVFEYDEVKNLQTRLEEMPHEKDANEKFYKLNEIVERKCADIKANEAKVPLWMRGLNVLIFIISVIVVISHITFNSSAAPDAERNSWQILTFLPFILSLFPLILGLLYIPINLIVIIRHKINKAVQKITGQRVVTTTISLVILFSVIIVITYIFAPEKYFVVDELLICISVILMLTDNLMLKNNPTMIEDYSKLNMLKNKIVNYTIMEDRDVEQVVLWEEYLSYAVSFGIANKIMKRIKGLYLDDDLLELLNNKEFGEVITSDYYSFYRYSSLDRRFLNSYENFTSSMLSSGGGSGGGYSPSSGGGR